MSFGFKSLLCFFTSRELGFEDELLSYCQMFLLSLSRFSRYIPVSFTTAFYVANVVARYWDQFISLPWPDRLAYKLVCFIPGQVTKVGSRSPSSQ